MDELVYKEDCSILRDIPDQPQMAAIIDCDGEYIQFFPASWTDNQIWLALNFANSAHKRGVALGEYQKTREVCSVLGITHDLQRQT